MTAIAENTLQFKRSLNYFKQIKTIKSITLHNYQFNCIMSVRYGVGYHLTLVKKENCNQNAVTSLIMNHVPNAQLLSSVGAEMEFVLSSEHSSGFETLFQEIESKLRRYH